MRRLQLPDLWHLLLPAPGPVLSVFHHSLSLIHILERFVRGDSSRTTEGSGLGLSIAENLVKLMKGTFELFVDGDLFKVEVTFPEVNKDVFRQSV